ncbi:hypothetical protein BY996DRAFT_6420486 [Phakopsora pachyrhizi]|nr:hypothetical protein BY996DRAFT_6420486 [Phakopsora pachyrhizi]
MSANASPSQPNSAPVIDPEVLTAAQSSAAPASKPASKSSKPVSSKAKPVSKSKASTAASTSKKPPSASKKPASSTTKKVTAPKKPSATKSSGDNKPSFEEMIKDAIVNDKENVRLGVSRPAIKKYLAIRYKVIETPSNNVRLNKAIQKGAEKGVFFLPKGASGKVKLAKVAAVPKPTSAKKLVSAKKPASKLLKKATTSKTGAVKKVSKKVSATGTVKKASVKKAPTAASKKISTAKKVAPKKLARLKKPNRTK